ncbi:DNA internalization-related competence protein ComEC/Rec2 [Paenibacillus mesophilus]|uniref:DNA internalization-related competence protein ComEC/Rec2 n=1 Tax=Paenibacillus mesophilus TaxID=2582849 RepID=UPI0013052AF3|nr:DNA internalization-related competence protein ComEC/Rec2 [Paenibacillus mesophilus]
MNRPLTWLAIVWVAGTAIGGRLPPGMLPWKLAVLAAALAFMAMLLALPGRRIIGCLLLLVAAAAYYQGYDAKNVSTIPPQALEREALLSGTIASRVEVDGDKVSFALKARMTAIDGAEPAITSDTVQVTIRLLKQEEQQRAAGWGRGDAIALSGTLKQPEPPRNFGGFDYCLYLYRKHIHRLLSVKGLDSVRAVKPEPVDATAMGAAPAAETKMDEVDAGLKENKPTAPPIATRILRWNDDLRYALGGVFDRLFADNETDSGYLKSLVIGLTDDMDPELYQQFSQLGLTHILAISGLHVAVFVAGCLWLLRMFGLTREKMLIVTMALVPFYIAVSGGSPSAVRAGIMAMIGLYMARRRLWKDALNMIGLAAVVMLLWEPYYLYDVSFQLSFLVTFGLIVGVPRFSPLLPVRSPSVNSLLSVTIVAQLISFPITVYYFNGISLLSALANLLLVPFISFVVLPLGTIALIVGLASSYVAAPVGWIVSNINTATFWLIDFAATHDPLRLVWPKPSLLWVAAYYVLLWAVYAGALRWKEGGRPAAACAAVSLLILFLWYGYDPQRFDRDGTIQFIDVGQGDAILVRTPQGRHMLIDGGGTVTFRKPGEEWKERKDPYEVGRKLLVPLLKQRGVHHIDWLVVSHQDQDHMGGLQAVVEQIPVRNVLMNGTWKGNEASRELFETAMNKGASIVTAPEGGRLPIDRFTELTALSVGGKQPFRVAEEQNGESLVLLMRMRGTRFLFTGDMRAEDEHNVLAYLNREGQAGAGDKAVPPIDVLKIAHHGSKTSTTNEWLTYWKPKVSVISVGSKNVYGHPNPGVVERLEQSGTEIRRTDLDGEIVFTVSEEGMRIGKKLRQ